MQLFTSTAYHYAFAVPVQAFGIKEQVRAIFLAKCHKRRLIQSLLCVVSYPRFVCFCVLFWVQSDCVWVFAFFLVVSTSTSDCLERLLSENDPLTRSHSPCAFSALLTLLVGHWGLLTLPYYFQNRSFLVCPILRPYSSGNKIIF